MSLIRLRGGTEYQWDTAGPTLRAREVGVTTDTHRLKVGDGVSAWADLPWVDTFAGLPEGGTVDQLLTKVSGTDFDTAWVTLPRIFRQDTEPTSPDEGDFWVDSDSTPDLPAFIYYQTTTPVAPDEGDFWVDSDSTPDLPAYVYYQAAEPGSPRSGDFWVDSDSTPVTVSTTVHTTAIGYTPSATDWLIVCTATLTVTLPTAVGLTGKELVVKNNGTGTVTVDAYSTQLIDGSLTQILGAADSVTIVSTGTGWVIV